MKNFKIIISFALCVALILCVSITAFAKGAGQGSRNATMTTAYENFDLYYSHTHHYVPYGTVVGRIVYYPASGDTTPKATYVRFIHLNRKCLRFCILNLAFCAVLVHLQGNQLIHTIPQLDHAFNTLGSGGV